jgi:hypothetical protein
MPLELHLQGGCPRGTSSALSVCRVAEAPLPSSSTKMVMRRLQEGRRTLMQARSVCCTRTPHSVGQTS